MNKKSLLVTILALTMVVAMTTATMAGFFDWLSGDGDVNKKNEKVITVGTGGTYNPWCFKKNDKLQGFEVDVWNEIAKRTGYKVEFKVSQFSGLMGMLDAGKIDTVAHQMSITPARSEKYNFTTPYAYSKYDFIIRKDSSYKTPEDLKGKKVGAWLGGNGERTLEKLNKKRNLNLNMKLYDGAPLEKLVETGRLDACWQAAIKSQTVIEQGNLDLQLMGANTKVGTEVNAYPFVKGTDSQKIIEEINKVIKEMHKDGTLSKLSMKWFGLDTTQK
ncbi:transporter substrate-binding domain-containing protein [Acetohalobium arabaticum]|uniref:Amino acid ABC transporter substrate-binding protein, PAAT family n=1 Tax=Acetohalobium arabaticum (strain ATCC 49924 / DSM 5501 / Z-7288) TaxID=574087 RepID=D9QUH2_ACEAZ|nr:transporter substrate-binding domain-containing protein [Acetohalobium arabaticum]ADL13773.1 amino acid ABC transporter substrate-binding protein, PAAT family [Acetohalobium arabaticum DSM 5501]